MRLVINIQNLYPAFDPERAAEIISGTGFDGVEYYLKDMTEPESIFNSESWQNEAERLKNIFKTYRTPIVQTHAPFSFTNWADTPYFEGFIFPTIVRSIEVSALMGAEVIVVHPLHFWTYAGNEQEIFERNMKFYRSLIPVCRAYNIKVGIENMFQRDKRRGNYIIHDTCSRIEEFCRYIDTLNSEYMVACLDIGHVGLPSGDKEAWDFVRILGAERLQALHIHDNDYTNDQHSLPYSGKIDWSEVCRALGEIDYSGDFTYECLLNRKYNLTEPDVYCAVLRYAHQIGRHLISKIDDARSVLLYVCQ